jgi:hypothetical protein
LVRIVELQNQGFEVVIVDDLSILLRSFRWYRVHYRCCSAFEKFTREKIQDFFNTVISMG